MKAENRVLLNYHGSDTEVTSVVATATELNLFARKSSSPFYPMSDTSVNITIAVLLLCLSGLFSGLNLGLMSVRTKQSSNPISAPIHGPNS